LDSQIWNACFQKHNHLQEKHMRIDDHSEPRVLNRRVDLDYPNPVENVTIELNFDDLGPENAPTVVYEQ
jgi:hypothetical protein